MKTILQEKRAEAKKNLCQHIDHTARRKKKRGDFCEMSDNIASHWPLSRRLT
jgi:hypothetical protein